MSGPRHRTQLVSESRAFRYGEIKLIEVLPRGSARLEIEFGPQEGDRLSTIVAFTQRPKTRVMEWKTVATKGAQGIEVDAGVMLTVTKKGACRTEKYEFYPLR